MQNATATFDEPDSISLLIALSLAIGYLCTICICITCIPPLCRHLRDPEGPSTTDKLLARVLFQRLFGCAFGPATALALGTVAPEPQV